ncbi:hypothetical protein AB0K12_47540 [Nonomuraea sp. NPDC049419]|uniref:hypothetical protein n=1 Tax=Nonomuraea sp. NPDC049419 TaxID=3155772 RepID=UPI003434A49D
MKRSRNDTPVSEAEDTGLKAREHEGLPAVHLRPAVLLNGGNVGKVQISPSPRTPSPFGSRMGDHTIAWTVHLDALKAELHGKPIAEAVTALEKAHHDATKWMADPSSAQRKMLEWLSDVEERVPRLEDSDARTRTHINAALKALVNGKAQDIAAALGPALAHHLAYVNYTPFATVRNLRDRSIGSAEAHYRRIILRCERYYAAQSAKMETDEVKPAMTRGGTVILRPEDFEEPWKPDAQEVKEALWRLFSFDAALRETGLDYALSPEAAMKPQEDSRKLGKLGVQLTKHLDRRTSFSLDVDGIAQQAKEMTERLRAAEGQQHLFKAAQTISNIAGGLWHADQEDFGYYKQQVNKYLRLAKEETQGETTKADDSADRFVTIMSYLLHEHQRLCSLAYPLSVSMSGFLSPSPSEAAIAALTAYIAKRRRKLRLDTEAGAKLLSDLKTALDRLPQLPAVDKVVKDWVVDETGDPLVVTFVAGRGADVNGRPPAPAGVAGMGCHTTAWVIQSTAVKQLLARRRTEPEGLEALEEALEADLKSDLMTLDRYLPLAQLEGGQLKAMFQAAFDTLTDATPGESAASYLTFRNLLPFATVDAGDRGGHGESLTASEQQTFDAEALGTTLELLREERRSERRRIVTRLRKVADELEDELTYEGDTRWSADYRITAAVEDSVARLRAEASLLEARNVRDPAELIMTTRYQEHRRLYALAH